MKKEGWADMLGTSEGEASPLGIVLENEVHITAQQRWSRPKANRPIHQTGSNPVVTYLCNEVYVLHQRGFQRVPSDEQK